MTSDQLAKAAAPMIAAVAERIDQLERAVTALETAERDRLRLAYLVAWTPAGIVPTNGHGSH
jgi:hypothetical protein